MKKVIGCLLAVVILFGNSISAYAVENNDISLNDMKAFLMEHNYPADYLETLIEPQIESLYETASEENAYFYSLETVVADIDESQGHGIQTYGNIPASQLEYKVALSYTAVMENDVVYIDKIYVNVTYDWKELPIVRTVDAITVNWDSSKMTYLSNSFESNDYALQATSGNWVTHKTWNAPAKLSQGGLGVYTYINFTENVLNHSLAANGLRGQTKFTLLPEPRRSMEFTAGGNTTTINAEYVHSKNPTGGLFALSFSVSGVSVSVNTGALTDEIAASGTVHYTAH